jgi:hypothetical protein
MSNYAASIQALVHGRGGKPTGGAGRSGNANRLPVFVPLTWHFRMPARCRHLPLTEFGLGPGVLGAEGVSERTYIAGELRRLTSLALTPRRCWSER